MTDKPRVHMENHRPRAHWFGLPFYRKEGRKSVLETRKLKRFSFLLFAFGYAFFLSQSEQPSEARVTSPFKWGAVASSPTEETRLKPAAASERRAAPPTKPVASRKEHRFSGPQVVNRPRVPLPTGTTVRAKLLTGASNGPVRAEIIEPILVNGSLLLEPGPVLVGVGSSTDDRLQIRFERLVFPDGEVQAVAANALDADDRTAGLRGSLLGNRAEKVAGSIGLSFTAGLAEGLQDREARNGTSFRSSSLKNALLNGVSTAAIDQSHEMLSDLRNSRPSVHVSVGREFLVVFNGE